MRRSASKVRIKYFVLSIKYIAIFLIFCTVLAEKSAAGDLGSLVRLDRLIPSNSTGGTICATPATGGNENSLQIIFPSGFTVNSTASHWTVNSTNIPAGSSLWPGMGTATNVSGQTVTFPSGNLSTNTQYCFNFSSTNTLTTPSSTGNFSGTLRTRDSSNAIIDTRLFAIPIVTNDQINVTATVPANPTDFHTNLDLTSPSNSVYQTEGTELNYKITYGSDLPQPSTITVEAEWSLGTVQGGLVPTEDILDYVVGSASYGYNGTPPVIDAANKKIDWVISTFPGGISGQTVTFKLMTKSNVAITSPIHFDVSARVQGPGTQTANSVVHSTFQKSAFITPTPTPTCAPAYCPTSTPAPTLIPTPTSPPTPKPIIKGIEIRSISSTSTTIYVTTARPSSIRVDIGKDFQTLRSLGYSKDPATQHLISLDNLDANARYYFRVIATDHEATTTSDLYLLSTANSSPPLIIQPQTLIISSGDVILDDQNVSSKSAVIIPRQTPFSFRFTLKDSDKIKSIQAVSRNNNVLGINTADAAAPNTDSVPVVEILPGQFVGKLSTSIPGNYKLVLVISDFNGNLSEQEIAKITVVQPLQIVDAISKLGIENVKVTFFVFNPRLRVYEPLSSAITPITNPIYTEPDGYIGTVLPEGNYRAEVSVLGYKSATIDFSIDANTNSFYPTITLTPLPFDFLTHVVYVVQTQLDILNSFRVVIHNLRVSFRFFNLVAFGTMIFLAFLVTFAASKRFSVPIYLLPYFAFYHLSLLFGKPKNSILLHGKVVDSQGLDVSGAILYIMGSGRTVLTHTKTSSHGEFFTNIQSLGTVKLLVSKKGFKNFVKEVSHSEFDERIQIQMHELKKPLIINVSTLRWYLEYFASSLFEAFLIVTVGVEILFTLEFGILNSLPFIVLSFMNIILFASNMRASKTVA